ncbi:DUF6907 domain-containing protein [Streptomyces sp. CA-111067]|uniref:DUF6907 domain-containing protein n=1 Tax=Streptomyces sp. CA-111067 TaxID=3240046 RepID=UPI003D95C7EA
MSTISITRPEHAATADSSDSESSAATWTVTTTAGFTAAGYLPAWADHDPSEIGVPLERLHAVLADVSHRAAFDGPLVPVWSPERDGDGLREERVLWGAIGCRPYAEDQEPRIPVVDIAIVDDYWINGLDPDDLADLAAKLRAQADHMEHEVLPQLVAARGDWAAHHGA